MVYRCFDRLVWGGCRKMGNWLIRGRGGLIRGGSRLIGSRSRFIWGWSRLIRGRSRLVGSRIRFISCRGWSLFISYRDWSWFISCRGWSWFIRAWRWAIVCLFFWIDRLSFVLDISHIAFRTGRVGHNLHPAIWQVDFVLPSRAVVLPLLLL